MSRRPAPRPLQPPRARQSRGRPAPQRRSRAWLWGALLLGLLVIVAASVALARRGQAGNIAGVTSFGTLPQGHQEGKLNYPQTPPAGGIHNPEWQNCGIYSQPVGNENAAHSLEHGAVWITYRPDLPPAAVEQLRNLVRGRSHALLSPYPNLPAPVVASAWGVQLKVESAADPRLAQFVDKYEQGPQTPESGATCRGALGTPEG